MPHPFPAAWLTDADVESVLRSVHLTSRSGRNAWRHIARSRPASDPISIALAEALR